MIILTHFGVGIIPPISINGPFYCDDFIWSSKDISEGNSNIWYQNYSLPSTKMLGFVACRATYQILCIGAAERSWGDVMTIKYGKSSHIKNS